MDEEMKEIERKGEKGRGERRGEERKVMRSRAEEKKGK